MRRLKYIMKSFILIELLVGLASCSGADSDTTDSNNSSTVQFLRFRPSNAKALGVVDKGTNGRSAFARSASTDALILKILKDGSFANFLTVPEGTTGNLAPICMILQSPSPETNCFFVLFKDESYLTTPVKKSKEYKDEETGEIIEETWTENQELTIGQFLCVFEDGSYNDILLWSDGIKRYIDLASPTVENSITFDKDGNLYFILHEQANSSTATFLYQYNPKTDTFKKLKEIPSDNFCEKVQISKDAKWFFIEMLRNGGKRYLSAIPVSNPDTYIDVYTAPDGSTDAFDAWVYDDDAECIYYSIAGTVYKVPKIEGTFNSKNVVPMFGNEVKWYINDENRGFITVDNNSSYQWQAEYKDGDSVDAAKVLAKLGSVCRQEIDFKLTNFKDLSKYSDLYTEAINEEAIKYLDTTEHLALLQTYLNENCKFNEGKDHGLFLNMTCFKKGTNESAYELINPKSLEIYWWGIDNFATSYQKSLYGSDTDGFVEIVDKDGKNKGERITLEGSSKLHIVSTVSADNGVYFLNDIDVNGNPSGKHEIMYYDVPSNKLTNLFKNIPDGKNLKVLSFSGGNNVLYFSAVQGSTVINAKIDTTTGTYTKLGSGEKLSDIIVVR